MKLLFLFFCLTSNVFGQSKITQLADLIKGLDKTWTLKIDTSKKAQKSLIFNWQSVGFLTFRKGKDEIAYCVYKSLKDNIDSSIRQTQKLASCSAISWVEKNRIIKYNS